MLLHFYKMTGAGNDFVMVDNRDLSLSSVLDKETIEALCDRRFGIGADGLIAVEPSQGKGGIVRMRYYNADGGEAEMCPLLRQLCRRPASSRQDSPPSF